MTIEKLKEHIKYHIKEDLEIESAKKYAVIELHERQDWYSSPIYNKLISLIGKGIITRVESIGLSKIGIWTK